MTSLLSTKSINTYICFYLIIPSNFENQNMINFEEKIILGFPTFGNKNRDKFALHEINTVIFLLNLVEMRKIKFGNKVLYIIKKGKKLTYYDEILLNDNFKNYNGIFPPEYQSRPWSNYKEIKIFNRLIDKVFDDDYFYFTYKYQTMRHFLGRYKSKNRYNNYIEDWYFFSRKLNIIMINKIINIIIKNI